jgi:hypothetical protein
LIDAVDEVADEIGKPFHLSLLTVCFCSSSLFSGGMPMMPGYACCGLIEILTDKLNCMSPEG